MSRRVEVAMARARDDALAPYGGGPRRPIGRERNLAVGDPQAPLEAFLQILDDHGALGDGGRLRDEVHLVSVGDHFDWGPPAARAEAAQSGLLTLSWLSAHPPDQVTLLAGNHDLGRVGELATFDDETFAAAQAEADRLHWGERDEAAERRFVERWPVLPGAEAAARDFGTFRTPQRRRVQELLRAGRLSAAAAANGLLLTHAGVTRDDLLAIGLPTGRQRNASSIASALNAALDDAVESWNDGERLSIPFLHQPGDAWHGEGRGIFFQRPAYAEGAVDDAHFHGPPRRRFDPRRLPPGIVQAVGHVRDGKCRELLGPWVTDGAKKRHGRLRHLRVRGGEVAYRLGLPDGRDAEDAVLVFIDGGMNEAPPREYELLDLDRLDVAERAPA
jgi:hypothetical protein